MGVIKKFNPETGQWEIYGSTEASDINLLDAGNNFSDKNVEGALREISNKLTKATADLRAHSATLVEHTSNIAWLKENGGGGGGGGGTASAPTITTSFEDGTIVAKGEEVKIPIFFTSPNLGEGTAYVMIDNVEVAIITGIKQGNNTINIGVLPNLKNSVAIYVKDRTNMLSNQLSWTIIAGGIDLEVIFDDTADYYITDMIMMQFDVNSASKEPIIMHMTIDYEETEIECENGFNEYIYPELGIGIHRISFYLTSGPYSTSVINYNIVVVSSNSLYVSSTFKGGEYTVGTPIPIQYRISKASKEEFKVNLYLNNRLSKTLNCPPGTYYWTLNDLEVDDYKVKVEVIGQYDEPQILELEFDVVASDYNPLKIIEQGLQYRLSARGRTNQDSDREFPIDDSGNGITTILHNFNFYTNGWIDDELVCDSNAYVEIDFKPWENNAIYGSTIEIQYTGLDIGLTDARILDYTDVDAPYKGIAVDIEKSSMKSLASTGEVSVDKDTETTLTFVIDRRNKFGKIFVNGVCSRAFFLSDSGSGVNASREDFTHSQKIYINSKKGLENFGACKVKDLRIYGRVLSDDEIVQNYIAQERNLDKQEKLYKFNYENTTLPVIRMYGDMTNMTLETPVSMRIKYTSPSEDLYGQSFDLPYCQVNWQGTSSLQYVLKNFTARLRDENMAVYEYSPYPNGIKEDVYCFKADYMESTHSRNVGIAKFVNACLYDTKNPMQLKDPNIRNSVNGFPCLMYINDELQGVYNFNLDRYSTKSFGYTDPEKCLVYEVSANSDTTAGAFYKWTEATGKDKLSYYKSDFECLYPPTRAAGNDNMSELIRLIEWVNDSSDEDFRDNFENYFDKEYVLRYYLFVLVFGAVDSLGKNMKLASWDGLKWYPQVYDADTTIGLDNTGFLKFDMDIEMGDEGVFNTTGSVLWQRIILLFQEELRQEYALMRQDRFTVDNIMKYLYGEQISQIPAVYYNKDMQTKYLNFGSSYLYALHGNGEQHIRKWIRERITYVDSLLGYMVNFDKDKITLRSSKLGEVYLDIETYIPMYVSVKWRDEANNTGMQTKRVGRGETVRFTYNMPTATDQEILVYAGYYLKRLGNVSNLQPTTMLIANASRLTEIECHSPNLINTDLSECTKLQRIDLSDCTALGTGIGAQPTMNIQNCKYLRFCDFRNTKLTAIYTMQAGGNLEEIYYPDSTQLIQLTNQTYLHTVGIPYGLTYCRSLADVEISNCHKIKYMHYPFQEGDSLTFEPLKYVQNLKLSNSLDLLTDLTFKGFNKLASVEINSMHNLQSLGFDDMMLVTDEPTLSRVVVSDCPAINKLTFNITDTVNKIAFAPDSVVDISGMQSVESIEANYPIKGLKTLIVPNSVKNIIFDYKYGDGKTDIRNIWSGLVNHSSDGFEGIDLDGLHMNNLTMDAFLDITEGQNLHITPTDINPKLNFSRNGKDRPYFRPSGSINLSKYTGSMEYVLKGLDLTKFDVVIEGNRPQQILTGLFEGAKIYNTDKMKSYELVSRILGCYPLADVWDALFKNADIDFDTDDIQIPDIYISTADMYRGTSITKDIDIPNTMINVQNMFRDCKKLKDYLKNWEKDELDYYDPDMIKSGCYFGSGGDLELVPPEWGGYGFYPEVTSEIEVTIPYENYDLVLCNRHTTLSIGVVSWGDGEVTFLDEDSYRHTYKNVGKYTIKGHFTFGPGTRSYESGMYFSPDESLRNALTKVNYLAQDTTDLCQAFKYCRQLRSVNIPKLKVTSLQETFNGCTVLSELNYPGSSFNDLTAMHSAFSGCQLLESIDLSNMNTKNVKDMHNMFYNCASLKQVDVSGFVTDQVENMADMFRMCSSLGVLDLSNFVTDKVTNMSRMFDSCSALIQLDISSFVTDKVTNMIGMFARCGLSELDLSHFNTELVESMTEMFLAMPNLTKINLSSFNTKNVKAMSEMFYRCTALTDLDLTNFDVSNVTDMMYMFTNCGALKTLKFGTFDARKVLDFKYFFSGCSELTEIDLSNFMIRDAVNIESMFINCSGLTSISMPKFETSNVMTFRDIFSGCRSAIHIDVSNFDTSAAEDLGGFFNYCPALETVDINHFNVRNCRRTDNFFKYCRKLKTIDLSNWETPLLENMEAMFFECYELEDVKMTKFTSDSLLNARELFNYDQLLKTIDFGQMTFNLVDSMENMFNGCYSIETLDLSKWNTFSVSNMKNMFGGCYGLTNLILGDKFTTKYVKDFSGMFSNNVLLTGIDFSKWDLSAAEDLSQMFEGCSFDVDLSNKNTSNVVTAFRMFRDYNGTSINMENCDFGNCTDNADFIYNAPNLVSFIPPLNITTSMTVVAKNLPVEAYVAIIDNLVYNVETQMLAVGSDNIDKIPESSLSIAVSKNWSIA